MKTKTYHVYTLQSLSNPERFYTGYTAKNPEHRLHLHNQGTTPHTAKYRPWKIRTVHGFDDEVRAKAFEKYLKSGSGRAFAKKRL